MLGVARCQSPTHAHGSVARRFSTCRAQRHYAGLIRQGLWLGGGIIAASACMGVHAFIQEGGRRAAIGPALGTALGTFFVAAPTAVAVLPEVNAEKHLERKKWDKWCRQGTLLMALALEATCGSALSMALGVAVAAAVGMLVPRVWVTRLDGWCRAACYGLPVLHALCCGGHVCIGPWEDPVHLPLP